MMSECKMSFKKCYGCKLSKELDPSYTITGKMLISYRLICKATGEQLEITECIKEA